VAVALALDRQERGRDAQGVDTAESAVQEVARLYDIPCTSILNLDGLIAMLRSGDGLLPGSALEAMEAYRRRYGSGSGAQ
jgi:orotate phosphoribosyltransferase